MERLQADVWVVGSGAAGLTAAIAARLEGADVAVVGKSGPGKATSTTMAVGAFSGAWSGLSQADYRARTLQAGRGINETELVDILVAEGAARFQDLIDWGLHSKSSPGAFMALPGAENDKGENEPMPVWGREIVRCQVAKAQAVGVRFVNNLVVRRIEAGEAGVRLTAYGARRGDWVTLEGGAAILAAGGGGALFQHHDNPQRIGGDAYTLAYEAGAVLQDVEFVQFYPVCISEPDKPPFLIEPDGVDLGRIVNGAGEDILDKYEITVRPAAQHARDQLSQAIFQEIENEGGEVYIDLTGVSKEDWCVNPISATKWAFFGQRYNAWGQPLRIAPVAHFAGGGAQIDAHGATTVPGLFAAGEATGGAHGANRMGGNALTECVVFGHRAGLAAADWAARRKQGAGLDPETSTTAPVGTGEPRASADRLKRELQRSMWRYGGIHRDREGLETGLREVREIAAEAAKTRGLNEPRILQKHLELQLSAAAAELILDAATRRHESRGGHYRADYPEADDDWLGHLKVARGDGGRRWWFEEMAGLEGVAAAE
ncbi:MAG: FAD-binding protein [Alphaproteobacteria bacterium]|jgi:aspartate oxidase|nr:FAD-binding protein [Alphaproteobacteria bacterium]